MRRGIIKQFKNVAGFSLVASACWEPKQAMLIVHSPHTQVDVFTIMTDNISQELLFYIYTYSTCKINPFFLFINAVANLVRSHVSLT